jgi:O-antigen/teichoic acid export membrane protein
LEYKKRFILSFVTNFLKAGLGAFTSFIIARELGPNDTGRLFFLLGTFASMRNLLDLESSSAFYTFIAKENRSNKYILCFLGWTFIQLIISLLIVSLVLPDYVLKIIWVGESKILIILALVASFMLNQFWQVASYIGEASRKTKQVQLISLGTTAIHLAVILVLINSFELGLYIILVVISIEWLIAGALCLTLHTCSNSSAQSLKSNILDYKTYCFPLIPYILISISFEFFEKWMLQSFSGSEHQAYFGLAMRISSIGLLATTSLLKVFWKEGAELKETKDFPKLHKLLHQALFFLYLFSFLIVSILLPITDYLVYYLLGEQYLHGHLTFFILLLYPIHQSVGQVLGTFVYSNELTKPYSILSSIITVINMVVTYFILAPNSFFIPGLGFNSVGLALKVVLLNIISTNILYHYICYKYSWKNISYYQFIPIGLIPIFYFLLWFVELFSCDRLIILLLYFIFIISAFTFLSYIMRKRILRLVQ